MAKRTRRVELTSRDRALMVAIFENRVMSFPQVRFSFFREKCRQAASRRLGKLKRAGFLERRVVQDRFGKDTAAYLTTAKALAEVKPSYPYQITSELFKSDSVSHDIVLVDLRLKLESIPSVHNYLTENMLQACAEFRDLPLIEPFVRNFTDGVIELKRTASGLLSVLNLKIAKNPTTAIPKN